ncbi:MAG: PD40 domain-containing protein, partial [Candidatus Delongbacteria bacterium]|nr:PD40 domain-containing protein [Candidatus Delongbacteria bacterium]
MKRIILPFLIFVFAVNAEDLADRIKKYNAKQITMSSAKEMNIVITEDGNSILFSSNKNGNFDIFLKDINTEEVSQLTEAPGNEFPYFIVDEDDLYYLSDATDIYGNIYIKDLRGSKEEIIYSNKGEEKAPVFNEGQIIFSKKTNKYKFYSLNAKKKKVELLKDAEGSSIVFSADGKQGSFISNEDKEGYNSLYRCSFIDGEFTDVEQVTFGEMIVNGVDVTADGTTLIYSAIKSDTDNNGILDIKDNPVLYKITFENNSVTQFQLTPETYSSKGPKISSTGNIYFISDKNGNDDIWMSSVDGVIPREMTFETQISVADFLF